MDLDEQRQMLRAGAYLRIAKADGDFGVASDCLHYLVLRRYGEMVEVVPVWRPVYFLRLTNREGAWGFRRVPEGTDEGVWVPLGDSLFKYAVRIA